MTDPPWRYERSQHGDVVVERWPRAGSSEMPIRLTRLDADGVPVGDPIATFGTITVQPPDDGRRYPCTVIPCVATVRMRFNVKPWSPLWAFMGVDPTRPIVASQRRRRRR